MSRIPSECAVCRTWPAPPLCETCLHRFLRPANRCTTCALRVPAGQTQCGACLQHPPPLHRCHAVADYTYPWATALAALKFRHGLHWARPLGELMRQQTWAEGVLAHADRVLPIPLSNERLRLRGYNQARELQRYFAPDHRPADWLLRLHDTTAQTSLDRGQRLHNLRGAFAVSSEAPRQLEGRHILLLDDVMTTGATLSAAAEALLRAGAAQVSAVVWARVPRPGESVE